MGVNQSEMTRADEDVSRETSGVVAVSPRAKYRILFVDDEPAILDGLRNALRGQRREWEMVFAVGGQAGLDEVRRANFDVVVTDMRMPGIDGARLLQEVKQLQPQAVRLVLSGQADTATAMKTVFTAHQFLAKPCELERLRAVVQRACRLNDLLSGEELRKLAGDVSMLPSAPGTYVAITEALADPNCSLKDVAAIVERDPALCAKVLQIVNSAFFGLPRTVTSLAQAASYLGTLALRNLALAMETLAATSKQQPTLRPAQLRAFQVNALLAALLGRKWFVDDKRKADDAFVAGMLRNMGHLVLSARGDSQAQAGSQAQLSAYLLGLWGIPHGVLEPVAFFEHPESVEHSQLEVVDVLHLVDAIANEVAPPPFAAANTVCDVERLIQLGGKPEQIEELRTGARDLSAQAQALIK